MRKQVFSVKLDDNARRCLDALAAQTRLTRGHLVREALRAQYGAKPLTPNLDAPWLNGPDHG